MTFLIFFSHFYDFLFFLFTFFKTLLFFIFFGNLISLAVFFYFFFSLCTFYLNFEKSNGTARLRLEEESAVFYRDVVAGERLVHSTSTSGKSRRLFHVMTSMASLISELPSADSSDNVQTYELPDDYIITVWPE